MKIGIYLFLLGGFLFCAIDSQAQDYDVSFVKSFQKNFRVPQVYRDSLLNQNTLLRVYFDENQKLKEISFSDNVLDETKIALKNILGKLDTKPLQLYLKQNKLRDISFIYPVAIHNEAAYYLSCLDYIAYQTFSSFSGKSLKEPCILRPTIIFKIYEPRH